jgi:leucyl-tRNA synthetase
MKNNEVFVCTERSVKNMAYQDLTETPGKWELLANIKGETLIGCGLSSPLTSYKKIYCYPMMTISMTKGTGIVTSVPSDSPDDFAALRDLKTKK